MEQEGGVIAIHRREIGIQSIPSQLKLLTQKKPDLRLNTTSQRALTLQWQVWLDLFQGKRSYMHHMHILRLGLFGTLMRKEWKHDRWSWGWYRRAVNDWWAWRSDYRRNNAKIGPLWLTSLIFNWCFIRRICFMSINILWPDT